MFRRQSINFLLAVFPLSSKHKRDRKSPVKSFSTPPFYGKVLKGNFPLTWRFASCACLRTLFIACYDAESTEKIRHARSTRVGPDVISGYCRKPYGRDGKSFPHFSQLVCYFLSKPKFMINYAVVSAAKFQVAIIPDFAS